MDAPAGPPGRPPFWDLRAWRAMYPGMWAWVLQRLSAVVLLVLFPFHVLNPYKAWLRAAETHRAHVRAELERASGGAPAVLHRRQPLPA